MEQRDVANIAQYLGSGNLSVCYARDLLPVSPKCFSMTLSDVVDASTSLT